MKMLDDSQAYVIAGGRLLHIAEKGGGRLELSCNEAEYGSFWKDYFDMDSDYSVYILSISSIVSS